MAHTWFKSLGRAIQMCIQPYLWTLSRCCQTWNIYHHWCSSSYTWALNWNAFSETSTSNSSCCTSYTSNTQTTASSTHSYHGNEHCKELPTTCSAINMTSAAPAATCLSTQVKKHPTWFLKEMWPGLPLLLVLQQLNNLNISNIKAVIVIGDLENFSILIKLTRGMLYYA